MTARKTTLRQAIMLAIVVLISAGIGLAALELLVRVSAARSPNVGLAELDARRSHIAGHEGALGDMVMVSANPRLVYELMPQVEMLFGGHPLKINSAGFRDDEIPRQKPAGEFRIAAIGDSGTFGWRVAREHAFSEALQAALNHACPSRRFEVMNFGTPGYNTAMELELLKSKVLDYQPDAVLLQFDGNDVDVPNFMKRPENPWRLDKLFLVDFVRSRKLRWSKDAAPRAMGLAGLENVPMVRDRDGSMRFAVDDKRVPPEFRGMIGEENTRRLLREFGEVCRSRNIPAFFLLNPNVVDWEGRDSPAIRDRLLRPFIEAAREGGLKVVDPSPDILEFLRAHELTSRDLWVVPHALDAHAVPTRHTLIARGLFTSLFEAGVLPDCITSETAAPTVQFLNERAEAQWESTLENDVPRTRMGAYAVPFGDSRESSILGDGWHDIEISEGRAPFRWTGTEATLKLPPATRILLEFHADQPSEISPPDYAFTADDTPLTYTVRSRGERGWIVVHAPPDAANGEWTMQIRAKKFEVPGVDFGRDLGIRVYSVGIEMPA
jgi:lysophospholipase L1-like esterase